MILFGCHPGGEVQQLEFSLMEWWIVEVPQIWWSLHHLFWCILLESLLNHANFYLIFSHSKDLNREGDGVLMCFPHFAHMVGHVGDLHPLPQWHHTGNGNCVVQPQFKKCWLTYFWWKRKVCGATSARKVLTRGFLAKKEGGWCELNKHKCQLVVLPQFSTVWLWFSL